LEHADLWYPRHIDWAQEMLGFQPLQHLPSNYVREHIYFSVQYERVAEELRQHVGVDRIMSPPTSRILSANGPIPGLLLTRSMLISRKTRETASGPAMP
jgi:hypothetical protein